MVSAEGGRGGGYGRARSYFDLSQYLQLYFVYLVYVSGDRRICTGTPEPPLVQMSLVSVSNLLP